MLASLLDVFDNLYAPLAISCERLEISCNIKLLVAFKFSYPCDVEPGSQLRNDGGKNARTIHKLRTFYVMQVS